MRSDPIDGHDFFYVKNKSHGDQREVEAKNSEGNFLVRLRKLSGKKVVKDEEQGVSLSYILSSLHHSLVQTIGKLMTLWDK